MSASSTKPPQAKESRYERKFVSTLKGLAEIERSLLLHRTFFREIYYQRYINNVYFDTPGWRNLSDSVEGSSNRLKTRIRWYGDLYGEIPKPALEFKSKTGLLVGKSSYRLHPTSFNPGVDLKGGDHLVGDSDLTEQIRHELRFLKPVLLNRYRRKYFLSADSRFRVTVDSQLMTCPIGPRTGGEHHFDEDRDRVIVELKYAVDDAADADRISQDFPFRLTRWSKYVSGLMDDYDG